MWSLGVVSATLCLASIASASFEGNLNYESPSRRHAGLGLDVPLIERRSWKRDSVTYRADQLSFTHGVASGDPWADSVILWTRIAPSKKSDDSEVTVDGTAPIYSHETEKYIKADANPICVEWKVFGSKKNKSTGKVVKKGKAYTTSDIDYTVKVNQSSKSQPQVASDNV
jgi:alkaline phosphatase D